MAGLVQDPRAEWIKWADSQEPGEFVETIPFTGTREHLQSVLRNAVAYRRIYRPSAESGARQEDKAAGPKLALYSRL